MKCTFLPDLTYESNGSGGKEWMKIFGQTHVKLKNLKPQMSETLWQRSPSPALQEIIYPLNQNLSIIIPWVV
jgi:hypothetical protein